MALEISKPSVWIPIVLTVVGMAVAAVVFAFHEFTPQALHFRDHEAQAEEIAGVSLNQQSVSARQNIKWLEQDLREFYKKHGHPPYRDPDVQAQYEKLQADLKAERDFFQGLRDKLKK